MWINKIIVVTICLLLCLIGALLLIIPSILMWNFKASDFYIKGVWSVYDNYFNKYDEINKRNTTVD
jgi:hypothetical protein